MTKNVYYANGAPNASSLKGKERTSNLPMENMFITLDQQRAMDERSTEEIMNEDDSDAVSMKSHLYPYRLQ